MVALVRAMRDGRIDAEPAVVLSNRPDAPGLTHAAELGVPGEVVAGGRGVSREEQESRLLEALARHRVDLVCLAGYMRLLGPRVIAAYPQRIFNIHPSLLPAFPGLNAQRQALEAGVKVTGCTVHVVDELCDHGPIILQASVSVLEGDTEETLSARILEQEHRIYPQAVALHFQGRLRVESGRVRIAAAAV
jgi:phosphoribosylglycinamide formyltransferase-1